MKFDNFDRALLRTILHLGTEAQRHRLGEVLLGAGELGTDESATQVVQKALLHAPQKVGNKCFKSLEILYTYELACILVLDSLRIWSVAIHSIHLIHCFWTRLRWHAR